nr:hypothetical protein [Tanacetum cinerariifolium]
MEPRPEQNKETIPPLCMRSPRVRRQRETVVGFEEAPNMKGGRIERNVKGGGPSELGARENGSRGMNLPSLLAAHLGRSKNGQAMQSSLTSVYSGHQPSTNIRGNLPPNGTVNRQAPSHPPQAQNGNPSFGGTYAHHPQGGDIEDYPLPDGLKMHFHIGSYDGKGDPDNYLYLFEGAIRMQKWVMSVACHVFTYTLKDYARIWWNSQKVDLPSTYKGLIEKTFTWIEAREVATNETLNDQRESFKKSKKTSWDSNKGQRSRDRIPIQNLQRFDEEDFYMDRSKRGKKDKGTIPVEAFILMISQGEPFKRSNTLEGPTSEGREITFPHVTRNYNSSAPVIIKVMIFGRQVNRVYMDSRSSCEFIYEHCFLKLKPSIRASKLDSKVSLVGFSREHYWPIGEVSLEITIGDPPFSRTETLNFAIVGSNSPNNLFLERTAMQKIEIAVFTIHGAIKFHTTQGIGTVFSTYEPNKVKEGLKNIKEAFPTDIQGILSCMNAEERLIINDKHPEQTVIIEKQLLEKFKEKLQNLLKSNAGVFAWTHFDMTRIPKTIMVGGKPFNTEHKLNKYSHIKPIKQKRRGLGPDRNTVACKEVEELIKAGILQRFKNQTWVANPVMVKKSDGGWRMEDGEFLTNAPIKQTLSNLEKSGRVAKWTIELGEHDIEFQERRSTKKEVPKDFLVEMPFEKDKKKATGNTKTKLKSTKPSNTWKLYTNGSSSSDGSGEGLMLINSEGKEYTCALRFEFKTTNNEAEYEAPLAGLQIAQEIEIERTPLNCSKNYKAGVLLAIDIQRCCEDNSKLCTMQGTVYGYEDSEEGRNSSRKRMSIQPLRSQLSRTPTNGPGRFKVSGNSGKALYEMGRGKATKHYKREAGRKVCIEIHNMQVRGSTNNQLKGRKAF